MRVVATLFFISTCVLAQDAAPLPEGTSLEIVVQEVRGEVEVQAAPGTKWMAAKAGQRLAAGAKIVTGVGGEAVILFGANSVAIVTEASIFEIRSFGMKGDELVAEAFIDPGVAHVSVKQLAQFQTDFQVSTPRLTCSVKGSAYTISSNGGAGLLDTARCNEHLARVILANLQQWVVAAGLSKDTSNDTPEEGRTRDTTVDVTQRGSTASEQVARLILIIAHALAIDPGSLTLGTSGSPTSGRLREFVEEHCSQTNIARNLAFLRNAGYDTIATFLDTGDEQLRDAAQLQLDDINEGRAEDPNLERAYQAFRELRLCLAAAQLLEDRQGITTRAEGALLSTTIDNLDVLEHLARDASTNFQGGIEGIRDDMFLFARQNGFPSFSNEVLLPYLDGRFLEDPEGLNSLDPALFLDRRADFLDDGSGLSFNDLDDFLLAADIEAHSPVSENAMALVLEAMLHVHFHIVAYALPPGNYDGQYDGEHAHFHGEEHLGALDAFRGQGDFDRFLAAYVRHVIEGWEDSNLCEDADDPADPCFAPLRHMEDRLIDVLRGFRGATGRMNGFRSEQEHEAIHAFVGFGDLAGHAEVEDIQDFQESHERSDLLQTAAELLGLAATADVLLGQNHHADHDDNLFFFQGQDPQEFQRRHDDFHDLNNFGFDAYLMDWQAVQDQARLGTLLPTTLGHALLDTMHKDFHLSSTGLPNGDQPGQYGFEHALFHNTFLDPLHATLEQDFSQFAHDLRDLIHRNWHNQTGIPDDVRQGQTGFQAHEHLHQALDAFHQDMHDATGTTDPGP